MKFEIRHRFSGAVLFSLETESMKLCVEAAVQSRVSLDYARLDGARLDGASLVGARLVEARLDGARLDGASLDGASLDYARLDGARLDGASLVGASLDGARLDGASLVGARLVEARLDGPRGEKLTLVGLRPVLQLGPLGSRCATLLAFLTDAGAYVRAGCFWGALDAFRAAVAETHGADSVHAQEYAAAIALIEAHARLWMPT